MCTKNDYYEKPNIYKKLNNLLSEKKIQFKYQYLKCVYSIKFYINY